MASTERGQRQEPTKARRTESDLRRRRTLADAAAGVPPGDAGASGKATRRGRFRCVIYLCGDPHADTAELRRDCTEYAEAFCWEITAVIEDGAGAPPPPDRTGLRQAIEHVRSGGAGAVVTARRSMISPVAREYDQVTREIEKAGGFLHVMAAASGRPHTEPA